VGRRWIRDGGRMTERAHRAPEHSDTERPVPRWALRAAYAIPWMLLPVCLWRLPFAFHFEMGQIGQPSMPPLWLSVPYVFGLSVLSEVAAVLCVGLVRRWGEVVPARVPLIGGRRIRPAAAMIPAALGGLVMSAVSVQMVLGWTGVVERVQYENAWWEALALVVVTPTGAWGPMVLALTYAYHVRRRPQGSRP
jgi:hypothetical protein